MSCKSFYVEEGVQQITSPQWLVQFLVREVRNLNKIEIGSSDWCLICRNHTKLKCISSCNYWIIVIFFKWSYTAWFIIVPRFETSIECTSYFKNYYHASYTYLYQQFGTFHVSNQRNRIINGQPSGSISMSHERGDSPSSPVPHGDVNNQLELFVGEKLGQMFQFAFAGHIVDIFKGPLDWSHLLIIVISSIKISFIESNTLSH